MPARGGLDAAPAGISVLVTWLALIGREELSEMLDLFLQLDHLELTSDGQSLEPLELREPFQRVGLLIQLLGLLLGQSPLRLYLLGHIAGCGEHPEHIPVAVTVDRGVVRVWADVAWDAGGFGDPGDHAVGVASVDRVVGDRSLYQRPGGALALAGLQDPEDRDGQRHGGRLVALADQVQDPVSAQGVGVVLDPYCGCFGGAQGVDPQQVGEGRRGGRSGSGRSAGT